MKFKLLIAALLLLLTVAAVSAEDNVTDEIGEPAGTFSSIQTEINNAKDGSTIELSGYYEGSGRQIDIRKNLTIEGNGATLDAGSSSRILEISDVNVVIKNTNFVNGKIISENDPFSHVVGSAVYARYDSPVLLINCTFKDCNVLCPNVGKGSGTVFSAECIDCRFINCYSGYCGGAIYRGNCINCYFENCSALRDGGALYYADAINSTFINCHARRGGAISVGSCKFSTFDGCYAYDGGAIALYGNYSHSINSIFRNCHAEHEGDAIFLINHDDIGGGYYDTYYNITNCRFENCIGSSSNLSIFSQKHNWYFLGEIVNCTFIDSALTQLIPGASIKADDLMNYYTLEKEFCVQVFDVFGKPICDENKVVFYLDGRKIQTVNVDGDGCASIKIIRTVGTYEITAECQNASITKKLIVKPIPAGSIEADDLIMYRSMEVPFTVQVFDFRDLALEKVSVVFKVNGKKTKTVKTDKDGYASVSILRAVGTYDVTAECNGITVTKKLTIKPLLKFGNVNVKRSANKLVLKASLAKKLKGKTIKFTFNGKTYKAKTDKKGVAKVTIKKSVLKKLKKNQLIRYQASYLKETIKKTARVK